MDEIVDLDASQWDPWQPERVAELLRDVEAPWAVGGGWAVDLFVGTQTREHADIEIGIPAECFGDVEAALAGFELFVVVGSGRGIRLEDGRDRLEDTYQVWVRDPRTQRYVLDVMREPSTADSWIFRRDRCVQLPQAEAIERTPSGIPYLRPGIVLLFKAKSVRDKDQLDFDAVLPRLEPGERAWLAEALGLAQPGHAWIAELVA